VTDAVAEPVALVGLAAVLGAAVARPRALPEFVVATAVAAILNATGIVGDHEAWHAVRRMLPIVGFLAAVLVIAELCDEAGLFDALGGMLARRARRSATELFTDVVVAGALVTAVLSLDATVILFTPVVLVAARRRQLPVLPHVTASGHLANTGSLLLPAANLTNLLAFAAAGVSFARFGALMALPWVAAIAVDYAVMRWIFRGDLAVVPANADVSSPPVPRFAVGVVVATLAGFVVCSAVHVDPAWAAAAGAVVLAAPALVRRGLPARRVVNFANPPFLLFVVALAVVVAAVDTHGLGRFVDRVTPDGSSYLALLGIAAVAAVVANVVNNLPATLLVLGAVHGTGPVLAALIGVNVGPNLTYVGSLATLLWRQVLRYRGVDVGLATFTRLGLLSVPLAIVASTTGLWLALRIIGTG
jgi:arsenical pump membrane protein